MADQPAHADVVYAIAGVVTFLNRSVLPVAPLAAGASSLRAFPAVLHPPGLRAFLVINFFYWMLYGQLFNVLAVYVSGTLDSPGELGWLVVFLQLGVTRLAERWTRAGGW
jgi:hypothetical protein